MSRERIHYYQVLTYIAYGFYLLLGVAWLLVSLLNKNGFFNWWAFFVIAVFGVLAYYNHLLTNLIVGILIFFISLIASLETYSGLGKDALLIDKVLFTIPAVSVLMSGILIFSFLKLNFKN